MRKNNAPKTIIKPVETDQELRLANDLMAKVHFPDYFSGLHWLETCGLNYPGFRREHTRTLWHNGELACSLRMNTETLRLGEARLKMGGLGWVTTEPRYRKRGLSRTLVLDTLDYMKQHGYHVSLLFGIPNFYHRFGFATALADYFITVDAAELLACAGPAWKLREAKPGDIRAIQKIHEANDAPVACSLLRSAAHLTNKWERHKTFYVLTTDQGKVGAYFIASRASDHLRVSEAGASTAALCEEVLAACARLAAEEAVGGVRFLVPPTHLFARYLLLHRSTHEMRVVRDCGGMLAFVNTTEALENLIPEWENLLAASALREKRIEFTFMIDNTPCRVRANRGAIDIAPASGKNKLSLSSSDLIHLITGYRYPADILAARRRILTAEARALITTLFPKRSPYVWEFDRF